MIRDHVKLRTLEFASNVTTYLNHHHYFASKSSTNNASLYSQYTSRVRETSLTDSDALSAIRSSQFDGMKDLLDRPYQYLYLNLDIATKLDQSQSYEPLETTLATTYSRPLNAWSGSSKSPIRRLIYLKIWSHRCKEAWRATTTVI
jgi:hypothetical protein